MEQNKSSLEELFKSLTPKKLEEIFSIPPSYIIKDAEKGFIYAKLFEEEFGNKEVILCNPVLTIRDDYPHPFSSGSNGYITKVRVKNDDLEFYHDWWGGGWTSFVEMRKKYKKAVNKAIKLLNL